MCALESLICFFCSHLAVHHEKGSRPHNSKANVKATYKASYCGGRACICVHVMCNIKAQHFILQKDISAFLWQIPKYSLCEKQQKESCFRYYRYCHVIITRKFNRG